MTIKNDFDHPFYNNKPVFKFIFKLLEAIGLKRKWKHPGYENYKNRAIKK